MTHVLGMKPVRISFCLKTPPDLMSVDGASIYEPLRAIREREKKKRNARQKIYKKWTEEGDEHRVRR